MKLIKICSMPLAVAFAKKTHVIGFDIIVIKYPAIVMEKTYEVIMKHKN